jgi:hypothetical protein
VWTSQLYWCWLSWFALLTRSLQRRPSDGSTRAHHQGGTYALVEYWPASQSTKHPRANVWVAVHIKSRKEPSLYESPLSVNTSHHHLLL